jgi:acetylornithine deacetylase/succinyl-diaminopimelate desuccinylase-like protein
MRTAVRLNEAHGGGAMREGCRAVGVRRMSREIPRLLIAIGIALACASPRLVAQGPPRHFAGDADVALDSALRNDDVQAALLHVNEHRSEMAGTLVALARIEAPSGSERARASEVARRMREIGLKDVVLDPGPNPNVIGRVRGRSHDAVLFVSTLDDLANIAELQRRAPRPPRVDGERVVGPGTNTSATTASMLAAAAAITASGLTPEHDLIFAAVAEEETGLKGMKRLYAGHRDSLAAVVDVLGDGRSITYGALGIDWWRVVARGAGGHTLNGGLPNVNQGIARAVDGLFGIQLPSPADSTSTVLNVAMLRSGDVFNHKPDSGWFSLDVRSLDAKILARTEDSVRAVLDRVEQETGIDFDMQEVQRTPGGQIAGAAKSPLVSTSVAIAKWLGLEPALGDAGSANLNVAIAGGTPAIGLGGERGGRRGYSDEWADIPTMVRSAKHLVLLAAMLR